MALFDLSAPGWRDVTARWLPAGTPGTARKGNCRSSTGCSTDPAGRPVAVRVFPGNTGDPGAFTAIVTVVRDKFGLAKMVMVGDRGMITSARIQAMNQAGDGTQRPDADTYEWITALRAPAIRKLMADDGPLQLSLFDQQDLAEITSEDFPGERLIACRNPVLAADRARTREELLAATEKLLAPLIARVRAGRLHGAGEIGVEVGKVITRYKTGKHFAVTITDHHPGRRPQAGPDRRRSHARRVLRAAHPRPRARARRGRRGHRLQEPQIRRTGLPAHQIRRPGPAARLPPARRTRQGPRADLHARLLPHLAPAPRLGAADLHRPGPACPRTTRSPPPAAPPAAQAKASGQHDPAGQPYHSFRGLLEHLATLTRNQVRFAGTRATVPVLAEPTSAQREAFELIGVPIPLTLR